MIVPTVTVARAGGCYQATIRIGRIELAAQRATARDARQAVLAMYENAVFGCDRTAARAYRERVETGSVSPQTRRRTA